ncbi:Similar to znf346: Zinc finger protein 346 (Xenopus laevis) [Cotesia congregata]|uniref:Similar to znf346: Zinc finger protein 346 (Xenopus laevis) n=1 Tax=Cotesia congregata TaxID=51543 RepID=A0A8J2HI99_COTCN|nr:Similar to znf346: Zinc finger protein 346 (Xenopus laevis) [Cotesia congregata]
MSKGKVIENPEVPGFEQNLPPPPSLLLSSDIKDMDPAVLTAPPPPPPPLPANQVTVDPAVLTAPPPPPGPPIINSYYQSSMPQSVPWWIPTDADSQEAFWYDQSRYAPPAQEKPKKVQKRKHEVVDPVQDAERVAAAQRELTMLMKPLKCDLCNAVMNSTLQAKLHYDGKPHQKKVSMYLNQSVKRTKTETGPVNSEANNDWDSYCDVCKTWFTSQTDAAQHYAGKKHIRATTGAPKQKTHKKNSNQGPLDPTGRFGIGTGFQAGVPAVPAPPVPAVAPPIVPAPVPLAPVPPVPVCEVAVDSPPVMVDGFASGATSYGMALRCDLCGVSANRLEQLETHRRGARHLKMMRMSGLAPPESMQEPATIDYSIYRTPSGSYYCAPCNKSFTSENSFGQHVESKKHKNQVNTKTQSNQTTTAGKKDKKKTNKL